MKKIYKTISLKQSFPPILLQIDIFYGSLRIFGVLNIIIASSQTIDIKNKYGNHLFNDALQKYIVQETIQEQETKQDCQLEDGPYCIVAQKMQERSAKYLQHEEDCITLKNNSHTSHDYFEYERLSTILTEYSEYYYEITAPQDKSFNELKSNENIGYFQITNQLNFDDMYDQFKYEYYQQTSVPIHHVNLVSRNNIRGKITGNLLARTTLPSHHIRHKLFDSKVLNTKLDSMETRAHKEQSQNPKYVYAHVHSPEVVIEFSKPIHLDHFHYRISLQNLFNENKQFYIRTYDNDRLVLDVTLPANQSSWLKVTYPRSKVLINKIVISQGVELDNFSLVSLMKIKTEINYDTLKNIQVSSYQKENSIVPKVNMEDIKTTFKEYEQVYNTLDIIANIALMQQLEKYIIEHINLKQAPKTSKLHEVLVDTVKQIEAFGIAIIYHYIGTMEEDGSTHELQTNLSLALSSKIISESQTLEVALNIIKFLKN